nr:RagB/SusD family nutrient uptake outer membrane protein [uncultured Porphyromonas sp.]
MLQLIRPLLLTLLTLGISACSLNIPVENELTDPNAITSVQTAYEALSSAYTSYPKEAYRLSLLSDDFVPTFTAGQDPSSSRLYSYTDAELRDLSESLWQGYYETIRDVNAVLVRLPSLRSTLSPQERRLLDYLEAEAKTLKALCYLELLQLFATPYSDTAHPAGIILKDRVEREELPRSTKAEVADRIETLLNEAITTFAASGTPAYGSVPGFLGREAAKTILARLRIYQGNWSGAEEATTGLIPEQITRTLIPEQRSDWRSGDQRFALFANTVPSSYFSRIYLQESNKKGSLAYQLPQRLYLEEGDLRHRSYIVDSTLTVDATTTRALQLPGKYVHLILERSEPSLTYVVRRSEPIFLRAEALARQGKEDEARTLINAYLSACQSTPIAPSHTGAQLLEDILHEKQREFVGEALRFYDLKRLGLPIVHYSPNETRISLTIPADSYKRTLPIPLSERSNSRIGAQNPGWPDNLRQP